MKKLQKIRNFGEFVRGVTIALLPNGATLKAKLDDGVTIWGENREGFGARGIYLYGEEYEGGLKLLRHFLKPGDVYFDIGANIGIYTLLAANLVGKEGMVVAVEPFVETAHRLAENVRRNGFGNVRVRVAACGKEPGNAELHFNLDRPVSFSLVEHKASGSVNVPVVSIDALCDWEGVSRLRFLKMDTEGFETEVLSGAAKTIATHRPIVQYESAEGDSYDSHLPGYKMFRSVNHLGEFRDINVLAIHEDDPLLGLADDPQLRLKPIATS